MHLSFSTSLAGQAVGLKEVDDGIRLVTSMGEDSGYFGVEETTLQPFDTPFGPRVSPMSSGWTGKQMAGPEGLEPPTCWFEASRLMFLEIPFC